LAIRDSGEGRPQRGGIRDSDTRAKRGGIRDSNARRKGKGKLRSSLSASFDESDEGEAASQLEWSGVEWSGVEWSSFVSIAWWPQQLLLQDEEERRRSGMES